MAASEAAAGCVSSSRMICGAAAIAMRPARPAPPTCRACPTRRPVPLSAYTLDRSLSRRQSRLPVGQHHPQSDQPSGIAGGVQGGYNWQTGRVRVRRRSRPHPLGGARHRSRPGSSPIPGSARCAAASATPSTTSWSTARSASRSAAARSSVGGATESKTHAGWTAGAGMEVGLTGALVGAGRVPVRRSDRPALCADRRQPRLRIEPAAVRRQLPLLRSFRRRLHRTQARTRHRPRKSATRAASAVVADSNGHTETMAAANTSISPSP